MHKTKKLYLALIFSLIFQSHAFAAEIWKTTAYCACKKCCGKEASHPDYGRCASGRMAKVGYIACNWLPFGTRVHISGLGEYEVQDRGARSYFGSKDNKIKHLDIYFETHQEALEFGVQWLEVEILESK